MRKIYLSGKYGKGKFTIVDDDIELPKGKWTLNKNGYAYKHIGGKRGKVWTLQGWIMQTPKGMQTDHLNGNRLDNRRANLHICTGSLNNQRIGGIHRGIHWYKPTNRWRVGIAFKKRSFHLGYFKNLKDAIIVYNERAKEIYGKMARLNSMAGR